MLVKKMKTIEELVLGTLSFYEPLTLSQLILDFDSSSLHDFPDFSREDLENVIKKLLKKKLIKEIVIGKEVGWMRIHPQKSWFKRLFYF
jgi:hypothetical protein